jgi:peptidoglycan/LPS O-acetylase OafA/YrhL
MTASAIRLHFPLRLPYSPHMHTRHHGLDTVRAAAIGMVLLCHVQMQITGTVPVLTFMLGNAGVDLFFVLSGFLIGGILLRGEPLMTFWAHRWLRTIPSYVVVTLVTFAAIGRSSWLYAVFLQAFDADTRGIYPPAWSLAVEEWFYFLFPVALLLLRRHMPLRRAFLAGIVGFLVVPMVLRACLSGLPWSAHCFWMPLRLDAPALGLLLAWSRIYLPGAWRSVEGRAILLVPAAACILAAIALFAAAPPLANVLFSPLLGIAGACGLVWMHGHSAAPASRLLALPIAWTARLAYPLYLVHVQVLGGLAQHGVAVALFTAIGIALLLHYAVERPGMAVRTRMVRLA